MNAIYKALVLLLFFVSAATILILKQKRVEKALADIVTTTQSALPKLLDLGSHSCIPCKMMMPILDTLRNVHTNRLTVEFIDVWKDSESSDKYGVRSIPTQIIFDATGKEIYRHEGFWSRKEIEEKLTELGIKLGETS